MVSDKIAQQREDVHFGVLRLLESRPDASQREIADELGVSVGAINFCVKALIDKGHIKFAKFKASKNKLGYVYVLPRKASRIAPRLPPGSSSVRWPSSRRYKLNWSRCARSLLRTRRVCLGNEP